MSVSFGKSLFHVAVHRQLEQVLEMGDFLSGALNKSEVVLLCFVFLETKLIFFLEHKGK